MNFVGRHNGVCHAGVDAVHRSSAHIAGLGAMKLRNQSGAPKFDVFVAPTGGAKAP